MNESTLLLRQVNPNWIQEGRCTSQVFKPFPKDEMKLSVYDGDLISAENSWDHFTKDLKFDSVGVLAVSFGECDNEALSARPDPMPFPEHAIIDFTGFSVSQIQKKAQRLKAAAEIRGWLFQP